LELNLNYSSQVILLILCIAIVILFYIRKRMAGAVVGKASLSRIRFVFLITGLFVLVIAFSGAYRAVSFKGNISEMDSYLFITGLLIATSSIINFLTSQIHIGLKGVSVPYIPFFIPRNQIIDYEVFSNTLFLKRKGKTDFKIIFDTNDIENVEAAIRQLQNGKD